jgi:hypothetical protein
LLITLSSCYFHVSPLSNVIPRYLTSLDFTEEGWLLEPLYVPLPSKGYNYSLTWVDRQVRSFTPLQDCAQGYL